MKNCCFKIVSNNELTENPQNGIFITKDGLLKLFCYIALLLAFAVIKIHFILWLFRRNNQ